MPPSIRRSCAYNRTYTAWYNCIDRCHNIKNSNYQYYGSRGISVCERWRNKTKGEDGRPIGLICFIEDMGICPGGDNRSLDRINNDGNYEPGNCRWTNFHEQGKNRRRPEIVARVNKLKQYLDESQF